MEFQAKPVKLIVGTTNILILADGSLSFTKEKIRQFCGKKLTTFEFDRRIKRYMPDKRYYRFNYEKQITTIPASFYKQLTEYLTSEGVEFIEQAASTYKTGNISVKMNPKFTDQEHQVEPIKYLSESKDPRRGLQLQTGKGKTYSATKAAINIGGAFMVVVSGLVSQWVESIAEQTDGGEDIWVIQGYKSLDALFKCGAKPPIFVASLETLRSYIKGKGNYEGMPKYHEFLEQFGITTKIVDEAHLNLHATAMIDQAGNIPHNIYLTATFGTANSSLKAIFNTFFPNQMRYGADEYDRYVDVFFYGHNGCIPEKICVKGRGYSHSEYEKHLLKHNKIKTHWYEHVFIPIVNNHYINSELNGKMKLLIFCRTIDMVQDVTDKCTMEWPHLDCRPFTGADPDINLVEADVIVSTHKSAGTGNDIKNLYCAFNTVSFKAHTTVKQILGRLRILKCGTVPVFIDLMDLNLKSHIRHWEERAPILKGCGLKYKEYRIR
jgi:hypothetical protein